MNEIDAFLPIITQKGKGDDTSMAGIIDTERVTFCADRFRKRIADEKFKEAIEKLKTKLEQKKKQFDDNAIVIEDLRRKISSLEQMSIDSVAEIESKSKEISDIEEKISALERDKKELVEQIKLKQNLANEIIEEVSQIELDIETETKKHEEEQQSEKDIEKNNIGDQASSLDVSGKKKVKKFVSKFLSAPNKCQKDDKIEQCESTPGA